MREVIPSRDGRDYNQTQRRGGAPGYEEPPIRGSNTGPVMRPQDGASRKRGPDADPPAHEGYLVSRAASHAPPHLVANYAAREEARFNASGPVQPVSEYRDESRNFAGADSYRDAVPSRRDEPVYDHQPVRDANVYRTSQVTGQERHDERLAPIPMQRSGPPPLYNGNGYAQPAQYGDPPSRDSQQPSYGGGGREAQRDHVRFEDVLPSRNGGGGEVYLQARETQGTTRYEDDRYIAPERIAPVQYENNGGQTLYAPARDMPPPVLQQQEAPPLYEPRERSYQTSVPVPPPMSGYHMSSIDSLPAAQYSSRGYESVDPRGPVPEYENAPRMGSSVQYADSYAPPSASLTRSTAYEPTMGPPSGNSRSFDNRGVPAVSGYAPPRDDVRQSGYTDDYQRGGRETVYEPAQVVYERVPPPVVYAASRLPMLDRGTHEDGMDGRGPAREPYREPMRQAMQEPERQYVREPAREYVQQPQPGRPMERHMERPQEPERRSAREMMQGGGPREPARQQQAVQEQPRQPPRGSFQNGSGPPVRQESGDLHGSRGPMYPGNDSRGVGGRDQGPGGPMRGANTGRMGRDGRPMPY